jgi:hypothetical protein
MYRESTVKVIDLGRGVYSEFVVCASNLQATLEAEAILAPFTYSVIKSIKVKK